MGLRGARPARMSKGSRRGRGVAATRSAATRRRHRRTIRVVASPARSPRGDDIVERFESPRSPTRSAATRRRHRRTSRVASVAAQVLDRPGYGKSAGPPREEYSYELFAMHVAAVADALGVERFYVSGHSSGGPCALACAAHLGDRVIGAGVMAGDCEWTAEWTLSSRRCKDQKPARTRSTPAQVRGRRRAPAVPDDSGQRVLLRPLPVCAKIEDGSRRRRGRRRGHYRGDGSRHRRYDVRDSLVPQTWALSWRRVAAPPRVPRGYSAGAVRSRREPVSA